MCDTVLDNSKIETIMKPYWFFNESLIMPALTIKNIPENLYTRLKESAQAHHRSMNSEILYCVERTLGSHKIDASEQIAIARVLRAKTTEHPLTDSDLLAFKNDDRP
jgi:plasmid stability protein